jgi:hypothetical protein
MQRQSFVHDRGEPEPSSSASTEAAHQPTDETDAKVFEWGRQHLPEFDMLPQREEHSEAELTDIQADLGPWQKSAMNGCVD